MKLLILKEMDALNFVDAIVAFLNIGLFSSLISRFTGANTAILVFCSLLYLGCEPLETIGIMLTYLVFLRLTIYTQNQKLNFKKLKVFRGFRVFFPILLIVISLFLYPFAALAIFLFLFMTEILAKMKEEVPDDRQMTTSQLIPYIAIGSVLITVSMICVKFIPAAYYYIFGGAAGLLLCFFFWWLGQDRDRLSSIWDKVIILSFILLGLFGFDIADWLDFLMANILFGIFSLSGMVIVFFGALGLRLFGYYEVSRKGKANLLSIGITVLALFLLFLTAPEPTGVSKLVDAFLPTNYYHFQGILNMF